MLAHLGIHPHVENSDKVRAIIHAPESVRPLCLIAVGHPAEEKPPRTQYDASRVHRETW